MALVSGNCSAIDFLSKPFFFWFEMTIHKNYQGEIASSLEDYVKKAQLEAKHNRPPTDASRPDQNESALQATAQKAIARTQHVFDAELTQANRTMVELEQKKAELQLRMDSLVSDNSLVGAVDADLASARRNLVTATEHRLRADVELKYFRSQNDINSQATYPESNLWHFAVVLFLAFLETAVNAFFYENSQGLLGGFTVALAVAVVNMGAALGFGVGHRYKNLVGPINKVIGWGSAVLFLVISLYCNALFSTFRSEYQLLLDPTDTILLREAFKQASAEAKLVFLFDMRIADLMSFILFGIGLLLSCVAFYKGYTFDDKYPEHGKLDRALRTSLADEASRQNLVQEKLREFLHSRRASLQAVQQEPAQLINSAARKLSDLKAAQNNVTNQVGAIQRDYSLVLGNYRKANGGIRATDVPTYFQVIDDLSKDVSTDGAAPVISGLIQFQEDVKQLRESHKELLAQKLDEIQQNSATVLTKTFNVFLNEVEEEAKSKISRSTQVAFRAGLENR